MMSNKSPTGVKLLFSDLWHPQWRRRSLSYHPDYPLTCHPSAYETEHADPLDVGPTILENNRPSTA